MDFELATMMMDAELREDLHIELAPCTEQEYFDAYVRAHKEKFNEEWYFATESPIF